RQTGAVVVDGVTDADGVFVQTNIPEGFYNLEATADQHGTYKSSIEIVAGMEKSYRAFLPMQLVSYNWSVIPVDTPDKYIFTLQATFETNVPAPVVTVSPAFLDLSKID